MIFQEVCHLKFADVETKKTKILFLSLSKNNKSLIVLLVIAMIFPLIIASGNASSVTGDITVDFGSRQNTSHPISQTFLGIGGLGLNKVMSAVPQYISQANLRLSRIDTGFETIFPTRASATNPSLQLWEKLDLALTFFQTNSMTPVLILNYTPAWLQPSNNPCTALGKPLSHVKPTDVNAWGQLAAQTVSHIDKNFPGLHPLYEFWNEPDGTAFWCEATSDPVAADKQRLTEYKALWAAAGPKIRAQAQKDGVSIQMGGPALSYSQVRASEWIPSLVNDQTVSPYIDFISFHHYSKDSTSWADLVSKTQAQNTTGYTYLFQNISAYVRNGKQSNPGQTPIYLDEYNGSACLPVNCPADPTYGPLWNALILIDLLNTVLIPVSPNGLAQNPPAGLAYFTWNEPPGKDQWCMFGTIDTNYDCALTGPIQPYPQYYAYQLFGGAKFLNITDGGYVANAVTPGTQGVYATGFYTNTKDNLVIVNTSATAYPNLTIGIQNPGNTTATTATVFTLNRANPQIATSQTPIQQSGNGYTTVVSLPAYTTIALSIVA